MTRSQRCSWLPGSTSVIYDNLHHKRCDAVKPFYSEYTLPHTDSTIGIERLPSVLPPDKATIDLATRIGREVCSVAQIAAKFSGATHQENTHPGSVRILDIGSGTGVLSIVAALEAARGGVDIKEVVAFDNDPSAVESTKMNYSRHLGAAGIKYYAFLDSWDDDSFWQAAEEFDVVVCNPPYLVAEENPQIRPGWESVNRDAMYVENREGLEALYASLARRALGASRAWSQAHFRLPREGDALVRRLVLDKGPQNIVDDPAGMQLGGDRLSMVSGKQNHLLKMLGEDPLEKFGQPLHALGIYRLPECYPYSYPAGDIGLHVSRNRGHELGEMDDEEYFRLMKLNGYPQSVGHSFGVQFL